MKSISFQEKKNVKFKWSNMLLLGLTFGLALAFNNIASAIILIVVLTCTIGTDFEVIIDDKRIRQNKRRKICKK